MRLPTFKSCPGPFEPGAYGDRTQRMTTACFRCLWEGRCNGYVCEEAVAEARAKRPARTRPVAYIAHRYGGDPANVPSARRLSEATRRAGFATVSPLQESIGSESTMSEAEWLDHGLAVVPVCDVIVVPRVHLEVSTGVRAERGVAVAHGVPTIWAVLVDGEWVLEL